MNNLELTSLISLFRLQFDPDRWRYGKKTCKCCKFILNNETILFFLNDYSPIVNANVFRLCATQLVEYREKTNTGSLVDVQPKPMTTHGWLDFCIKALSIAVPL